MNPRFRGITTKNLPPAVRGVIYYWPEELEPTPAMPPLGDFDWIDFDHETQVRLDCGALAEALLNFLPQRMRVVVVMRVFMDMTLEDIGGRLGVGKERIRQIETKAIMSMKNMIQRYGIDGVIQRHKRSKS